MQLNAAASTISHTVLFNMGGRAPFYTATPAFALSLMLSSTGLMSQSKHAFSMGAKGGSECLTSHKQQILQFTCIPCRSPHYCNTCRPLTALSSRITRLGTDLRDFIALSPLQAFSLSSKRKLRVLVVQAELPQLPCHPKVLEQAECCRTPTTQM